MSGPSLLDPVVSGRLCLMLLHSVWQVALLALAARSLERLWRKRSVEIAYTLHVGALLAALAALPVTYIMLDDAAPPPTFSSAPTNVAAGQTIVPPLKTNTSTDMVVPQSSGGPGRIEASGLASAATVPATFNGSPINGSPKAWLLAAPWVVLLYFMGVLAMVFRLLLGMWQAARLTKRARVIADGPPVTALRSLAAKWSMRMVPVLAQTEAIVVPKVVGLLRPTILLPTAIFTGLTPDQLQLILAHELAHVRRSDLWVNLIQRVAEAGLFFNPALWYLSRRISSLREYCCDELACQAADNQGDTARTCYATALLRVVEIAHAHHAGYHADTAQLAGLAASGRAPSEVRRRVARLFGEPLREPLRLSRGAVLMLVGFVALLVLGPVVWPTLGQSQNKPSGNKVVVQGPPTEIVTLRQQSDQVIESYERSAQRRLKSLTVSNVSPAGLETIGGITELKELYLVGSDLRTEKFQAIASLTNLETLHVTSCKFLPEQMAALKDMTTLRHLELTFTIYDESSQSRRELLGELNEDESARMEHLLIQQSLGTHIAQAALLTDRAMVHLSKLAKLQSLRLINTHFTAEGFKHLKLLTAMETLDIGVIDFSAESAQQLEAMANLRSFQYVDADDAIVARLARLKHLQELNIWSEGVTDVSADHLAKLTELTRLEIRGNQMTDQGLLRLAALQNLELLDLKFAKSITPSGVAALREKLPGCKVIMETLPEVATGTGRIKESDERANVAGRIVMEDGSLATAKGWLYARVESPDANSMGTVESSVDQFDVVVHPGNVTFVYFPDGFAPSWIGPLELKPGQRINGARIALKPGFSVPLRVMNRAGQPIEAATVVIHPVINDAPLGPAIENITNEQGAVLLQHLARRNYSFRIEAPGYEPLRIRQPLEEGAEPLVLTMTASQPTTGIVRNSDGTPSVGAKVLLKHEHFTDRNGNGVGNSQTEGFGKVVATTDAEGRFVIDQLSRGSNYLFIVETADQARLIVDDIAAGLEDLELTVPPRLDLIVNIKGDLSKLPEQDGKPFVSVHQRPQGVGYVELIGKQVPIEPVEGGGRAIYHGLAMESNSNVARQTVEVTPGFELDQMQTFEINQRGTTEAVLNLTK